jgi:hypothetical protein
MPGYSVGSPVVQRVFGWRLAAIALALLVGLVGAAGCAHNVAQDKATGADGKPKGAKKITLEQNEGKATGIVTYPGGDRVDWRLIELPEGKRGTLDLRLRWTPARPGLDLAFDVYDDFGTKVGGVKPRKGSSLRTRGSKKTSIANAKGKYLVQVYAPQRGDAGKYTLTVAFQEEIGIDPSKLDIPDPPKLPAVPDAPIPCDETSFDKKNPACKNVCPSPPDMAWPACSGKCPTPADINIPACHATMACPNPPDRRVRSCLPLFPPCDPNKRDPGNPNCDNFKRAPVTARIINVQTTGSGEAIITVNRGSDKGVAEGWKGQVVGGSGQAVNGGSFTVIRVTKREAVGKVRLTTDQLNQNPNVVLSEQ